MATILGSIGALVVVIAAFQPWYFDLDPRNADRWFPIGFALAALGLIASDLVPELRWARWGVAPAFGVLSVAVTTMWNLWWGWQFFDAVDRGLYLSFLGGVMLLVGSILPQIAPAGAVPASGAS